MKSDLVEFIEYSFGSVWTLELFLLLCGNRERQWRADELVRELRGSEAVARESIDRLVATGLVLAEEDGAVHCAHVSHEQDALVRQLEEEYRKRPAAIRRLIVRGPAEKLKSFSDVFRLRRGDRR